MTTATSSIQNGQNGAARLHTILEDFSPKRPKTAQPASLQVPVWIARRPELRHTSKIVYAAILVLQADGEVTRLRLVSFLKGTVVVRRSRTLDYSLTQLWNNGLVDRSSGSNGDFFRTLDHPWQTMPKSVERFQAFYNESAALEIPFSYLKDARLTCVQALVRALGDRTPFASADELPAELLGTAEQVARSCYYSLYGHLGASAPKKEPPKTESRKSHSMKERKRWAEKTNPISRFLFTSRMTYRELAQKTGVSRQQLRAAALNPKTVTVELAAKLEARVGIVATEWPHLAVPVRPIARHTESANSPAKASSGPVGTSASLEESGYVEAADLAAAFDLDAATARQQIEAMGGCRFFGLTVVSRKAVQKSLGPKWASEVYRKVAAVRKTGTVPAPHDPLATLKSRIRRNKPLP